MKTISLNRYALCALFLLFITTTIKAQQTFGPAGGFEGKWRITAGGGTSLFFGDVKQYQWYPVTNYENEWRFGGNLMVERSLSPLFSLRGQALYAHLAGTRREWKTYFNSEVIEFNLNTAFSVSNLIGGYRADRLVNVNIIAGIGLTNYNTTRYELGTDAIIARRGFGNGSGLGGRTLEGILVGGLGIDFQLNENISIRLETANRAMNSDLLDIHESGFPYDVYNHTSLGVSYTFGSATPRRMPPLVPEDEPEPAPERVAEEKETERPVRREPVKPDVSPYQAILDSMEKEKPAEEPEPVQVTDHKEEPKPAYDPAQVEYRVQVRARYGRRIPVQELRRLYNLPSEEIKEDEHNGYYIYTMGSYSTYDEAARNRNRIRSQYGIHDAFIVAFQYGRRLQKLP